MSNNELTPHKQLDLFTFTGTAAAAYSNQIEIYDTIPRFYYDKHPKRTDGIYLGIRTTEVVIDNQVYFAAIKPARLIVAEVKDGVKVAVEKEFYPGAAAEHIEDVLKKMVVDGRGDVVKLATPEGPATPLVCVGFRLKDVASELRRTGHSQSIDDIKQNISIMNESTLVITTQTGTQLLSSAPFPIIGIEGAEKERIAEAVKKTAEEHFRRLEEAKEDDICFVVFNPMVSSSIFNGSYRVINYDKLMATKKPTARRLYKRLAYYYTNAAESVPYTPYLTTLVATCGIKLTDELNQCKRTIDKGLKELQALNVVADFTSSAIKDDPSDKRKVRDYAYKIEPHEEFIQEVRHAHWVSNELNDRREALLQQDGDTLHETTEPDTES